MTDTVAQDEFLISLKFQNNLPNAPSGPFLKNISISQTVEEVPEFRTSTLEKGYIWQPHFGPDLGVKLDLVDQDAILAQDRFSQPLDQSDLKYLTGTSEKSRGKTKQIDQSSKPWWLRNTTYMENNLYNVARVKSAAAESMKEISAKRPDLNYKIDMLSTSFINDSFDLTAKTVAALVAKNLKHKLVRELPVVPMDSEDLKPADFFAKVHSLVRFDEDPVVLTSASSEEGYSSSSSSTGASSNKRRKVDAGIITNLRQSVKTEDAKNQFLEVSLVSPLVRASAQDTVEGEVLYNWVKDYRMDVQHSQLSDSFLFVYKAGNNKDNSGEGEAAAVQYFPIRSRVDMKKMNPEDSLPHECIVVPEKA